ncbi:hypothetical protein BVY01_03360 [bacterium I07]|nr:hypothetical protein BVY01_03360 [bacterium I07]
MREQDVHVYIGYLPLHSAPMGIEYGYKPNDLAMTEDLAGRIVRLPFYAGMADEGLDYCIAQMNQVLKKMYKNNE